MATNVFISHPIPAEVRAYLDDHCRCSAWQGGLPVPRKAILEGVSEAEGLLTVGGRIDDELLDHAPNLRVVSNISVGYDNLDIEALRRRGVIATHTPGVLDETVADLVMTLMLSTARRVPELDALVKSGEWRKGDDRVLYGVDVHHTSLGIIGMGRIGETVARRARMGFGMEVLYHNRRRRPDVEAELGVLYRGIDELLASADFVLLMLPLTPETAGFMGAERFRRMKRSAIFINASRGGTVDEHALVRALEDGEIRAAGLDVYAREPLPGDSPLTRLPQVVTLPHIGSATARTRHAMADLAARNLVAVLSGERPPSPVPELATAEAGND
ncbi:MAG TPA: D-glycerate dehydrogenase [Gammaproteobacteria bacterium]|nr:D-glycerate dehydrogenase [Gammaproteobacteria bacterium]